MSVREVDTSLGLGGAGIGNHRVALNDEDAHDILQQAWESGIRLFDTAPHYGLGLSERRLGDFLASRPREGFRLSTKVGRRLVPRDNPSGELDDEGFLVPADTRRVWDFTEEGLRASLEGSMERLRVDYLDTVYLHDPERFDLDDALAQGLTALQRFKSEGLVRSVGVGSMSLDSLLAAARSGVVDELMVAGRYTLVDQEAAQTLLPLCQDQGIDVVAAAVFNGGLLTGAPDASSTYDYAAVPADVLARAREIYAVCVSAGVPIAAAALQFPLRHPAVSHVVVGVVAAAQVTDDVRLLQAHITEDVWSALEANPEARP